MTRRAPVQPMLWQAKLHLSLQKAVDEAPWDSRASHEARTKAQLQAWRCLIANSKGNSGCKGDELLVTRHGQPCSAAGMRLNIDVRQERKMFADSLFRLRLRLRLIPVQGFASFWCPAA